ncbi:MAG: hypothetical protein WDN28_15335 [Chthoniobacter sp.]
MHVLRHLPHVPHLYRSIFALGLLSGVVPLSYLARRSLVARRHRSAIARADILYRESFASGTSQKNLLTQFGGAHACLRLVVTKDLLVITSWFPFTLLMPVYDLEHAIPISHIVSLDDLQSFERTGLLLIYADATARHIRSIFFRKAATLSGARSASLPDRLPASP